MARFLSIDADSHGLLVAAGTVSRDKPVVERLIAATDLAQPLTSATAALIGARLKQLLKDAKIAPAPALVVIGRDRIILKDVKHPPVPASDEPNVIRFAALKEIAEGGEDMAFDYLPLPGGINEKHATVAFAKKDVIAAVRTMCEAAGLKLAAITPRPFAAVAALTQAVKQGAVPPPEPGDSAIAIVVVHEGGGEFTISRGGVVGLTRTIPSAAIATETAFVAELRRNLAVASGQAGSDVQAIYLAEAETRGEGWSGRLRADLGLPVYSFDPLANLSAAESIPAELHGRFLGAVGLLSARGAASPPINFAQPRQPRRGSGDESPGKRKAMLAAIAAVLLLGTFGVGGWLLVDSAESKVAMLRNDIAKKDEQIKQRDVDMKRITAVDEFNSREINWLDEIYEAAARFPDIKKARMTHYEGNAIPLPTEKERQIEAAKPPNKNAPPKKVATLKVTIEADNSALVEELVQSIHRDSKYYLNAKAPVSNKSSSNMQTFVITADVARRPPSEYTRKVIVVKPEPAKGEKPPEPVKVEPAKPDDESKKEVAPMPMPEEKP